DNRHVRCNAVVIVWIALRNSQRLASTLRCPDEVIELRPFTISTLNKNHRRVVSLLQLHVAQVLDGFVTESPVIAGNEHPTPDPPGNHQRVRFHHRWLQRESRAYNLFCEASRLLIHSRDTGTPAG